MPRPAPSRRRVSHAAIVCFSVSAIAFVACAMGLFVNHMLTGSLAISGTAAVGLIYLAMGLMNLGTADDVKVFEVSGNLAPVHHATSEAAQPKDEPKSDVGGRPANATGARAEPAVATRDAVLSSRD